MALVRWRPFQELETFRREMDRLFEDFFGREWPLWRPAREIARVGVLTPAIDMYDKKDEIVVKAEVPGLSKEDINLELAEGTLTLSGELKREEEVKEADYYCCERAYGKFSRTIELPTKVQTDKAEASFKDGILEIHLPKVEEAKPKQIKVQVK